MMLKKIVTLMLVMGFSAYSMENEGNQQGPWVFYDSSETEWYLFRNVPYAMMEKIVNQGLPLEYSGELTIEKIGFLDFCKMTNPQETGAKLSPFKDDIAEVSFDSGTSILKGNRHACENYVVDYVDTKKTSVDFPTKQGEKLVSWEIVKERKSIQSQKKQRLTKENERIHFSKEGPCYFFYDDVPMSERKMILKLGVREYLSSQNKNPHVHVKKELFANFLGKAYPHEKSGSQHGDIFAVTVSYISGSSYTKLSKWADENYVITYNN